ncbi:unnamed protein product, partial [marine sediment metagenome]
AIFTVLNDETGTDIVKTILETAQSRTNTIIHMPFIALMEAEYLLLRSYSPDETEHVISRVLAWPMQLAESSPEWRHQAAYVKSVWNVSLADAWIAGLAILLNAKLIHKDPEFDAIPQLQTVRLPSK